MKLTKMRAVSVGLVAVVPIVLTACLPAATYSVSGNKILMPDGVTRFVPYGYVVECMSFTSSIPAAGLCNASTSSPERNGNNQSGSNQVTWAAHSKANTIRFQVAPANLFNTTGAQTTDSCGTVNTAFLTLMDGLVNQATTDHMVAIVTDQEENSTQTAGPMAVDQSFWGYTACHYAGQKVFFDLFNEPYKLRTFSPSVPTDLTDAWTCWRSASTTTPCADGKTYVSMQTLADTVRTYANNIIVAEGVFQDQNLSDWRSGVDQGLPAHLLTGSNIAYGIEPDLFNSQSGGGKLGLSGDGSGTDRNAAQWAMRFGTLAATYPIMPEAFVNYYGGHCDPYGFTGINTSTKDSTPGGTGTVPFANTFDANPNAKTNTVGDVSALADYLYNNSIGFILYSQDPGTSPLWAASGPSTSYTSNTNWGGTDTASGQVWDYVNCSVYANAPGTINPQTVFGQGALFAYVMYSWSLPQ